jgi:hypothetical protein
VFEIKFEMLNELRNVHPCEPAQKKWDRKILNQKISKQRTATLLRPPPEKLVVKLAQSEKGGQEWEEIGTSQEQDLHPVAAREA